MLLHRLVPSSVSPSLLWHVCDILICGQMVQLQEDFAREVFGVKTSVGNQDSLVRVLWIWLNRAVEVMSIRVCCISLSLPVELEVM